jgi:hypothetical protein
MPPDMTSFEFGKISSSGTVMLTVTARDSRGYSTSLSTSVTVIAYSDITFETWGLRRINDVDAMTQLQFTGIMSPITINDSDKNALAHVRYRYKETTAPSWGEYAVITGVTGTSRDFAYTDSAFAPFDDSKSYNIQLEAADKLSTYTLDLVLPKGIPLMAFRAQKVGINNPDPQAALDVIGDIWLNGVSLSQLLNIPPN